MLLVWLALLGQAPRLISTAELSASWRSGTRTSA